tara:strand:+ start:1216 stop:1911 length:696 start_codon:yes stop_codon:yes gene_type:complete
MSNRDIRRLMNSSGEAFNVDVPIGHDDPDGETSFTMSSNRQLSLSRKHGNSIWKTYLSNDGNQYVDKDLRVENNTNTGKLEYRREFVDYRVFKHSFTDDLPGSKIYVPWQGTGEQTTILNSTSGYLSPYNMTCHKVLFRTPAIDTAATDIVFGIDKIDSGDNTIDSICTFDATSNWSDNTNFTINKSDWSASPTVSSGDLVGISLTADNTNIVTSEKHFHMTSVWKITIVI